MPYTKKYFSEKNQTIHKLLIANVEVEGGFNHKDIVKLVYAVYGYAETLDIKRKLLFIPELISEMVFYEALLRKETLFEATKRLVS